MDNITIIDDFPSEIVSDAGNAKRIKAKQLQVERVIVETRNRINNKEVSETVMPTPETKIPEFSFHSATMPEMKPISKEPVVEKSVNDFVQPKPVVSNVNVKETSSVVPDTFVTEEKNTPLYNSTRSYVAPPSYVPNIKSETNIGDVASQYRRKLQTIDVNTKYGEVLSLGVKRLDVCDEIIKKITTQISDLSSVINEFDAKTSLAKTDKQKAEAILGRFNNVDLGNISNPNDKVILDKLNDVLDNVKEKVGSILDIIKEQENVVASLEEEKSKVKLSLQKAKDNLALAEQSKKDVCKKLGEDLNRASEYDDSVKKTREEKASFARKLEEDEARQKNLLGGISILKEDETDPLFIEDTDHNERYFLNDDHSNDILKITQSLINGEEKSIHSTRK